MGISQNLRNLRQIIKYCDNEPLELTIALTRITIFPIVSWSDTYTPWWLIIVGMLIGLFQIWATSTRNLFRRNQANFISLMLPIMVIAFMVCRDSITPRIFVMSTVFVICFWNFWKTSYQLSKRGYTKSGSLGF
jgi:uncharacterized membrane protein